MDILPGVLGFRTLRRSVRVRLGHKTLRMLGTRRKRLRCAWHATFTVSPQQFMKHPG
jgi:hypothetical protein